MWDLANFAKNQHCAGDFNDILSSSEKRGPIPQLVSLINGFRATIEDAKLIDVGMKGYEYTSERGRGSKAHVEERLDRVLGTQDWLSIFPNVEVFNFDVCSSDHMALHL